MRVAKSVWYFIYLYQHITYVTIYLITCVSVCNVTIDSMTLLKQSGKTFGQIKSRVLEGPASCWFMFVPNSGQRVEIQVYRLVSIGRFNGTSCEGGSLRLISGRSIEDQQQSEFELCGANERYAPPVVLFSDHTNPTTLLFSVGERTQRSQFLAYFSFTGSKATSTSGQAAQQLAYQPRGGTRLHNTTCDWLYQDFSCSGTGSNDQPTCVMASPGYPGAYPPNRVCNYYVTTSSMNTRVRFVFLGLLLPHGRCDTDNVAIYHGAKRQSPHLHTFCGSRQPQEVEYTGPNLLLEFSSGPAQPPFNYNGFLVELRFDESSLAGGAEEVTSDRSLPEVSPYETIPSQQSTPTAVVQRGNCDIAIYENESRSGHFDTRGHDWSHLCRFIFKGRSTDVVHVSLFNYKLRTRSCNTIIEIWDGVGGSSGGAAAGPGGSRRHKPMHKICSPQTKYARDHGGSFLEHQTFVSSGPTLTLVVRRTAANRESAFAGKDLEFMDGAYLFHDEQTLGTLQPSTICDVSFYGLSSPAGGTISNPGGQHLYWNVEGALRCTQQFVPAANQSVTVSVRLLGRLAAGHCETRCGDAGCECAPDAHSNRPYDHLLLQSDEGRVLVCLCGAQLDIAALPVTVRSWTQLTLVYSVASYSWNTKGFDFTATYAFERDASCGLNTIMAQSGEIRSEDVSSTTSANNSSAAVATTVTAAAVAALPSGSPELNHFFQQSCVWILDSNVERQLFIELSSNQSRPCGAWNISVHEYSPATDDGTHLGELLYTFCPRDRHKSYSLPWKLNTVVVRLRVMSRTSPQYRIKWRSQVVRANTRLASPTPAPNAASPAARPRSFAPTCLLSLFASILLSSNVAQPGFLYY